MGLITDFFFAPADALDDAILHHGPKPPLPVFDCKRVDNIKLATLLTILDGGDLADADAVLARMPESIAEGADEGPWIFPVPDELASRLAALPPSARHAVAQAWARTEEWRLDGADPRFPAWFEEFCTFISQPRPDADRLWLWMCL